MSHAKREARTDLAGHRALLTGGRAKIGMYNRAAAAARRRAHHHHHPLPPATRCAVSAALPDSAEWMHRLKIVGIDLRDPAQVIALADDVAAGRAARHPDQQRHPDRAPLARRLPAAGGLPSSRRCPTARCRSS